MKFQNLWTSTLSEGIRKFLLGRVIFREHFTADNLQNLINVSLKSLALIFFSSLDKKYESSIHNAIVKMALEVFGKSFLQNGILEFRSDVLILSFFFNYDLECQLGSLSNYYSFVKRNYEFSRKIPEAVIFSFKKFRFFKY